jgi:hypothetical protein
MMLMVLHAGLDSVKVSNVGQVRRVLATTLSITYDNKKTPI